MTKYPQIKKLPVAPNETTRGDILHSAGKAAAGLVPFAGSAISEALDHAVRAPAKKRMEAWLELVEDTVNKLIEEVEDLTPQSLGESAAFTTAVISTTRAAMLTERRDKLEMLQSALHTTGAGFILDEVLRNTFLATIDRYSPEHVLLLYRCSDLGTLVDAFRRYKASTSADVFDHDKKEYATVEFMVPWILTEVPADVAKELFSDLHRDRFCKGSEGFASTFYPEHKIPISTPRGMEFLRFIFGPSGTPINWTPKR